jgi:hypothetical protein
MGYRRTVFEAAGGNDGLRRLAYARHKWVMANDVVAHEFSQAFTPGMSSDSPLIGPRHSASRLRIPIPMVTKPP